MSVGFEFYTTTYGGTLIPAEEWINYEAHAAFQLARYKEIYQVSAYTTLSIADPENMAICAMADVLCSFDNARSGAGGAKSASIGSVSISYGVSEVDTSPKAQAKELYSAARRFLSIYRGA